MREVFKANRQRLATDFDRLSTIGCLPTGGLSREAFTTTHLEARSFVRTLLEEADLTTRVDAAGNLFGRTARGSGPVILTGSHLDAVPNGGKFDGALGVIGALEAARVISESEVDFKRPIEVVAFAEEEGRFTGLLGSAAMVGSLDLNVLENLRDLDGVSFRHALSEAGLDLDRLPDARRPAGEVFAFVELHIEQGDVLENEQVPVGIVTAIAGTYRLGVEIRGRADHAGATPMDRRRDALLAAAELVLDVRRVVIETGRPTARGTVSVIDVEPNVTSVVPEVVRLVIDLRDIDAIDRQRMIMRVEESLEAICNKESVVSSTQTLMAALPLNTSQAVREEIEKASQALNLPYLLMASGASHDAQNVAQFAPTGMIFVPSHEGRSHSPAEYTSPEQCATGVDVLIETLRRLERLPQIQQAQVVEDGHP